MIDALVESIKLFESKKEFIAFATSRISCDRWVEFEVGCAIQKLLFSRNYYDLQVLMEWLNYDLLIVRTKKLPITNEEIKGIDLKAHKVATENAKESENNLISVKRTIEINLIYTDMTDRKKDFEEDIEKTR